MKGLEGNHNLTITSEISEIKMADSIFFSPGKPERSEDDGINEIAEHHSGSSGDADLEG